jgi:hypothetical protein
MILEIWHDQPAFRVKGIEVSSIGFWLTSDSSKPLPQSFSLLINARVFGAQVGSVTIVPLKNIDFTMPLLAGQGGTVEGRIDDWSAFDANGKPVDGASDPQWKSADSVALTVTGIADVTLGASNITSAVPGLSLLAKLALTILGNKVKISVAHEHVVAPLPHSASPVAELAASATG